MSRGLSARIEMLEPTTMVSAAAAPPEAESVPGAHAESSAADRARETPAVAIRRVLRRRSGAGRG